MRHPFASLIGFEIVSQSLGESRIEVAVREELLNPHGVVHGGVLYSLADTGMGAALYPMLEQGETCTTVNCAISYFKPVKSGPIACLSKVRNKGRRIATLESEIWNESRLVATAHGQFSILSPK